MISCSWCGETYIDAPIYHVCPDGSSFTQRNARSPEEYTQERQRRARCEAAREEMSRQQVPAYPMQKALPPSSHPDANPANINWSASDLVWLKELHIKP